MKLAYLLLALTVACSATTSSPSDSPDDSDFDPEAGQGLPPAEGPPESCVDESGDSVECSSDSDCCPGFYCGLDPQGSARIKTCVYGGG